MFRDTLLNKCRIHKNYNTFKEYFGVRNSYVLCINVINILFTYKLTQMSTQRYFVFEIGKNTFYLQVNKIYLILKMLVLSIILLFQIYFICL